MTDTASRTPTLAGAIEIVRVHGLVRQVPLVLGMMAVGFLDGLRVISIFPILPRHPRDCQALARERGDRGCTGLRPHPEQPSGSLPAAGRPDLAEGGHQPGG